MKDGKIASDETRASPPETVQRRAAPSPRLPDARLGFTPSELLEQIKVAFKAIWSHKTRSVLTILGIFIGVGAIIGLMTISEGFMKSILSGATEEDAKTVWVTPLRQRLRTNRLLTYSDVEAIRTGAPLAERITPKVEGSARASFGGSHVDAKIGTREGYTLNDQKTKKNIFENRDLRGRFFTPEENLGRTRVAVINRTLAKKLFGADEPALNNEFRLKGITFTVIGVAEDEKAEQMFGGRPAAYIPLNTASKRVFGRTRPDYIEVTVPAPADTQEARRQIITALRGAHSLREDQDDDFDVMTLEAQVQMFKQTMGKISLVVYGIAGIALLVGGIGIMNIMLVSVTERTREIGIRLSVGARRRDILLQFLTEAIVLSLLGGLIGVAVAVGGVQLVRVLASMRAVLNPFFILLSVAFAAAVGVFFGYYPARKAANMNPIDALRTE
jgi:putative ABC transport system permease protein